MRDALRLRLEFPQLVTEWKIIWTSLQYGRLFTLSQKEKSRFQGKVGAGEEGEGVEKKGGAEC